jgi:hypothetical protein
VIQTILPRDTPPAVDPTAKPSRRAPAEVRGPRPSELRPVRDHGGVIEPHTGAAPTRGFTMPDRDEQAPEDSEQRDLEQDAQRTEELPEGSNPDSPHHESTKQNLEDAKAEQPDD